MDPRDAVKLALFDAVRDGDAGKVRQLVAANPWCVGPEPYGNERQPPLHYAAKPALADLLLDLGFDVDGRDPRGATALHAAAARGRTDVAKALLKRGARPDAQDARANTPLHLAAGEGKLPVVKLLLPKMADPGLTNAAGKTALDAAADWRKAAVVDWLAAKGLRPSIHEAARRGDRVTVGQLLEREPGLAQLTSDCGAITPLHEAADAPTAEALLAAGAPLAAKDAGGRTPLLAAVEAGRLDVVLRLLGAGADPTPRTMVNETALHLAARGGHTGIVRALLAAGLDPNVKARGKTPWMEAEAGGHAETAQVLAATAAPPDIFQAALGGSVETVAALLAADPALARARSAAGHTPLHSAAAGGHEPVVRLLVDQGADVNALDERHMAPLHLAAQEGYEGIVALLLERGADVNGGQTPERQAGFTPLHTASMSGHLGIMRLLLDRGADLTLLDEAGQTALDWANEAESERWREAARLLQEAAKATRGR